MSEGSKGKPPAVLCILCSIANAAYQWPGGVFVVPITMLKMNYFFQNSQCKTAAEEQISLLPDTR